MIDQIEKIIKKPLWTKEEKNKIIIYIVRLLDINEIQSEELMAALKIVQEQKRRLEFYRSIYLKALP